MTDETQLSATETATTETAVTTQNESETSDPIADIVSRFGIEEQANQFRQTTQPAQTTETTQQTQTPYVPDPTDPVAMQMYLQSQAQGNTALQSQVAQIANAFGALQAQAYKAQLDQDISAAVKVVDGVAGIGKPKVIEAYLDAALREDARAKAIWDNRGKNPKALAEMLQVVGRRAAKDFDVKQDPKLVEAQRARKAAQQANSTTKEANPDDEIGAKQGADFEREWANILSGGNSYGG